MKTRIYNKKSKSFRLIDKRINLTIGKHYAFWPIPSLYIYPNDEYIVIGLVWFNVGLNCSVRRHAAL
jgi:hypothetical protein